MSRKSTTQSATRGGGSRATRYLEQHGGSWRVAINVPRDLQAAIGTSKLKKGLGTDSLQEANRRKWAVVAELQSRIAEARRSVNGEAHDHRHLGDDLTQAALFDRERLQGLRGTEEHERQLEGLWEHAERLRGRPVATGPDGEPVYDHDREAQAGKYITIATGRETPIDSLLTEYHEQRDFLKRTEADNARAVRYLIDWCRRESLRPTIERLGRREGGRFVRSLSTDQKLSAKTINKYLSCLSSYWQWLDARGHGVGENVWRGQSLPMPRRAEGETERPFRDHEVAQLLQGSPQRAVSYLKPLMMIAALTGARIDAIVSLKVGDVQEDSQTGTRCLRFKPQKKERSSRLVPIHTDLLPVIEEMTAGKTPDMDLFTKEDGADPRSAT